MGRGGGGGCGAVERVGKEEEEEGGRRKEELIVVIEGKRKRWSMKKGKSELRKKASSLCHPLSHSLTHSLTSPHLNANTTVQYGTFSNFLTNLSLSLVRATRVRRSGES